MDKIVYIAGNQVIPVKKDSDGNFIVEFAGIKFAGTYSEWILFARNLSNAISKLKELE